MDDARKEFELLKKKILRETNLDCTIYKENYLRRRILVRMRANGIDNYAGYIKFLTNNREEYKKLLDDITINVTQFFRDPETFKVIEEEVLPLIIYEKVRANRCTIRAWSAGCSSGEEAYSVAILLYDLLGEEFDKFIVSVLATDIDDEMLEIGKRGIYNIKQLENVKKEWLQTYFVKEKDNYRICNDIKGFVRFRKSNLSQSRNEKHFDLILCRNVVIYFSKEMQSQLYLNFYNALNSGGFLILGKTEILVGDAKDLFTTYNAKERIYRKL
ncbi:MAG: protein-glutamate O-methyltransferase CheR [Thermoplasmata archaeon]